VNIEFHYYVIHLLASRAGIPAEQGRIIARSSQYVDDSIIGYDIDTGREIYETAITQNYGWWDASFPRTVYLPFHFFPAGDNTPQAIRRDHGSNMLSCTANSPAVKELLIAALKTRNPYRVGIALHTFADSWAHQNFSGALEDWNTVAGDLPVPSIGHAQALTAPDEVATVWTDPRLKDACAHVQNRERFLQAAMKIYRYLCLYNHRTFDDADVVAGEFRSRWFSPRNPRSLEERILDLIIETDIPQYDRREWLDEAVVDGTHLMGDEWFGGYKMLLWLKDSLLHRTRLLRRDRLKAKGDFYTSHLYRWNEAARAHLREAQAIWGRLGVAP
jgi:hypothetical protein